jgi:hypothetical protein
MPRLILVFIAFWSFAPDPAHSASLPGNLTPGDIEKITQLIGEDATTKLMRSAENYRDLFPGIKLGVEFNVLWPGNLETLGNGQGSVPSFLPQPRFHFAKSLPFNLEFIFSFFPTSLANTVSTWGGILKWTFYPEDEELLSIAGFVGYTDVQAFNLNFTGSDLELGIYASKDFVRIRPYLGVGVLFTRGTVAPALAATATNSASLTDFHPFLGMEIKLPVDLTVQLDLLHLNPRASFSIGKTF